MVLGPIAFAVLEFFHSAFVALVSIGCTESGGPLQGWPGSGLPSRFTDWFEPSVPLSIGVAVRARRILGG